MSELIELIGRLVDFAGVAVMVVGMVWATLLFLLQQFRRESSTAVYQEYRHRIGRSILLGLEILVAADIIGTVAVEPTFQNVGVLGLIVLIRTFLSISLEAELEGRWPFGHKTE